MNSTRDAPCIKIAKYSNEDRFNDTKAILQSGREVSGTGQGGLGGLREGRAAGQANFNPISADLPYIHCRICAQLKRGLNNLNDS